MNARAGQPAQESDLIDPKALIAAYYELVPDVTNPEQKVAFGTSGHRGSSLDAAFNETHIAAITQAIVEYRTGQGITGPLFIGRDTHGLSRPAETTALEVLVANGVRVLVDEFDDYVPTPALSHAIIAYNLALDSGSDDGLERRQGRRHRHHPVAQPAPRRRLQVQPAARWTCRQRRHQLDRGPRQRAHRRRQPRREIRGALGRGDLRLPRTST